MLTELSRYSASEVESGLAALNLRPRDLNTFPPGFTARSELSRPVAGFAVTVEVSGDAAKPLGSKANEDWWRFVKAQPKPAVIVALDRSSRKAVSVMSGRLGASVLHACGAIAFITDGAVRDASAVPGFTMFSRATTVRHGSPHIVDFGRPVTLDDCTVRTGDFIFADNEGVLVFPPEALDRLPSAIESVRARSRNNLETILKDLNR